MKTRLQEIRDKQNWNYSTKTDDEITGKTKAIKIDFQKHKFRPGEYYDRYLYKLLEKYDLTLSEYYAGNELLGL